ncbi:hypothetical protein [Pelagerythrobacter sp.]|uniref:hypothetical protein n=1 Tax=Pelagerythrobacter sp. TaxID=2800702 RepID=UPI0035AED1F5
MQYNTTMAHSDKRRKWEEAYAAHDAFAEAGDDGTDFGGTAIADRANEAESQLFHEYLTHPSTTPAEMQDKLTTMRKRGPLHLENLCWNEKDITAYLDLIERDLINMVRPNVSKAVADAFDAWSRAHEVYWSRSDWSDDASSSLCETEDAAAQTLHAVPCTTPGDFIAKAYVELMSEYGAQGHGPSGLAFAVAETNIGRDADRMKLRDIIASDLGCCMTALGTTDFDAGRWVAAARLHGKQVSLMLTDTGRQLSFGDPGGTGMLDALQRLTANGLKMISKERCIAIADEVEANHRDLVYRSQALEPA